MGDILSALALDPPSGPWTADDYFALPESSTKVELQDGCYVVSPAATGKHQRIATKLTVAIVEAGRMAYTEWDVRLSDSRVRRPDVIVLHSDAPPEKNYPDRDDVQLVVEIISPSSNATDRLLKPAEYAQAGIPGFWLVEPGSDGSLTAFVLDGNSYRELGTWRAGETARITEPFTIDVPISDLLN